MRPANIVTAFADILAGSFAAAGILSVTVGTVFFLQPDLYWLLLSTFGLYGGGIVYNDVFDAELDLEERPERAIPSGRVTRLYASLLGTGLLLIGVIAAFQVHPTAGILAVGITIGALFYDSVAKHSAIFGPLVMGGCRGGNLMLGVVLIPDALPHLWPLALLPVAYIGAITLISQGEVSGGSKRTGLSALGLVTMIAAVLGGLSFFPFYKIMTALPFLLFFTIMVIPPFYKAAMQPDSGYIRAAVKRGVLSLIIVNATIAAGFSGLIPGTIIILLLPLSIYFSKIFAVT